MKWKRSTVHILHFTGGSGSDVDFRKRTNKRDGMEGITDPYHRETIGKLRNQMWCIVTIELNALVEIIDGLSKPQANNQERGETYRSM